MVHIKDPLLLIRKVVYEVVAEGVFSCYLRGPLPYVGCHITVIKKCTFESDVSG